MSLRSKKKEDFLGLKRLKRDFLTISKAKQNIEKNNGQDEIDKI